MKWTFNILKMFQFHKEIMYEYHNDIYGAIAHSMVCYGFCIYITKNNLTIFACIYKCLRFCFTGSHHLEFQV